MTKFLRNAGLALAVVVLSHSGSLGGTRLTAPGEGRGLLPFNDGWLFHFAADVRQNPKAVAVTLPHTWNAANTYSELTYRRDAGVYIKKFNAPDNWRPKRLFLYFEGANSVATVLVNGHYVTTHQGGYTAFCAEVTGLVKPGQSNTVEVQVSNAYRPDVLPLCGDFNVYGGIHRPVSLIVTGKDCITPLDYASSGVYVTQSAVSAAAANLSILTRLSLIGSAKLQVKAEVLDSAGAVVASALSQVTDRSQCRQALSLRKPHLWTGLERPYLYRVRVRLLQERQVVDEMIQPLGIRYYHVSPDNGFFLNGQYLDLHGFGLHEDAQGIGSAFTAADYRKDMQLIAETGATALRLTHYPHGQPLYNWCDSAGIVLWSEIPLVGPGGFTGAGYIKSPALEQQARLMLTEMIRQNYNHPSVCFWGLFNELKLDSDDPLPFLKELDALAKSEDPGRITTCASFLDDDRFNGVSDVIAWNRYFGWYGGEFREMGAWADRLHRKFPQKAIAVSEYGAGASPYQHSETLARPDPGGRFHPEGWQALYHEENWRVLNERPFIWGKFVWCLADFGSYIRTEGDSTGINDKGLVTYDRRVRKDAFYFYKANWSRQPVLYLTDRRNTRRSNAITDIKAYSSYGKVQLYVNGKPIRPPAQADAYHIVRWTAVPLLKGANELKITALDGDKTASDTCNWTVTN